jgi:hypothetical protein
MEDEALAVDLDQLGQVLLLHLGVDVPMQGRR